MMVMMMMMMTTKMMAMVMISLRETGASGTFVSAELALVVDREDHQRLYECRFLLSNFSHRRHLILNDMIFWIRW